MNDDVASIEPTDNDSFSVVVPTDTFTSSEKKRSWDGRCKICGTELDDKRRTLCDAHRSIQSVTPKTKTGKTRKGSSSVENRLNGVTANLLATLTLIWAWSVLRRAQIPDPSGNISTQMSFTDEEAVAIGRPLTRLFLKFEPGRRAAPVIIDNEDIVTAVFSLWDWYKRMNETLDDYRKQHLPTPTQTKERYRRGQSSTASAQNETASGGFDSDYLPPGPYDQPL